MKSLLILCLSFFYVSNAIAEEDLFSALDTSNLPVAEILDEDKSFPLEDDAVVTSVLAKDPDLRIRDFYKRRKPVNEIKIPASPDRERLIWKLGETIRDLNIPIGEYSVVRAASKSSGFFIRYLGKAYSDGKHLTITEAGGEIVEGDLIVKEKYDVVSLPTISGDGGAVKKDSRSLGRVTAFFEPDQDESFFLSGNRHLIGAKFKEYKGGHSVSIGATFVIRRKGEEIARAVVVDADLDLATMYIYKSAREVIHDDEVFVQ